MRSRRGHRSCVGCRNGKDTRREILPTACAVEKDRRLHSGVAVDGGRQSFSLKDGSKEARGCLRSLHHSLVCGNRDALLAINFRMDASPGSSSLGKDAANLATPNSPPSKIEPVIAKEWRASSSAVLCAVPRMRATRRKKVPDRTNYGCDRAEPVRIWKARSFVHQHIDEKISLTQVAKAVNTSANYLSEKFKEFTGETFVRYVALARYEKAHVLLRNADLRVSEIAFAAGFQSLSQFNRVFKKFSGVSPTEYRAAVSRKPRRHRR